MESGMVADPWDGGFGLGVRLNQRIAKPKPTSSSPPPTMESGEGPSVANHWMKKWIAPKTAAALTTQRRLARIAQ